MVRWTPDRPDQYPFGKKIWKVEFEGCGYSLGDDVLLTLSTCSSGEYTCNDGSCIKLEKRCDLRVDCPDDSDEIDCSLLDIPPGYSMSIPPPPLLIGDPLRINVSVQLTSFPVIKTQELTFEANMKLLLNWQDIRLSFLNLKVERSLNLLSNDDVMRVWTPSVFFTNANGNLFTNLDKGSRVELIQRGEPVAGGPEEANEGAGRTFLNIRKLVWIIFIYLQIESCLVAALLNSIAFKCILIPNILDRRTIKKNR